MNSDFAAFETEKARVKKQSVAALVERIADKRLLTKSEAAEYCNISKPAFSKWVASGIMPKALPGTKRWDKVRIDESIDLAQGVIAKASNEGVADKWLKMKGME